MQFSETRWSVVIAARGGLTDSARAALSDLCAAYYEPVQRFLRCEGRSEDEARELTHAFFARVLNGQGFDGADPERGRFRSFVLGALKHFLADARRDAARAKRGGGAAPEPLEAPAPGTTECHPQFPDTRMVQPDVAFDRQWAMAVLARALAALQNAHEAEGKAGLFTTLRPWLAGTATRGAQDAAAASLGITENALRVAIHRLRQRFRIAIREELAQTLSPGISADEEFEYLRAALWTQ